MTSWCSVDKSSKILNTVTAILEIFSHPKSILPSKKRGNIAEDPLKYRPIANTDVPARHMDENNRAPTVIK